MLSNIPLHMPKKVDEIRQAIVRENPKMDESATWAIAWAAYKKKNKDKEEPNTKATRAAKKAFKNYVR